jgi:hypothetical protein
MKKILIHHSDEQEYNSIVHNLYDYKDSLQIILANVNRNLFDIYNKSKPGIVMFPASDYSQEIHDFISEYSKSVKIIVVANIKIDNQTILNFLDGNSVWLVGKKNNIISEKIPSKSLFYDNLYNSKIYRHMDNQNRNDKIAVILSDNDDDNMKFLVNILYPKTKEKLCLFNSNTFKHPQNLGYLSQADINLILNTFNKLIDITDSYSIEAQICGIENIEVSDTLLENIHNNTTKPKIENTNTLSYSYFIANHLLKII